MRLPAPWSEHGASATVAQAVISVSPAFTNIPQLKFVSVQFGPKDLLKRDLGGLPDEQLAEDLLRLRSRLFTDLMEAQAETCLDRIGGFQYSLQRGCRCCNRPDGFWQVHAPRAELPSTKEIERLGPSAGRVSESEGAQ